MFEYLDLNVRIDLADYKKQYAELSEKTGILQRKAREYNIPVMLVVEGFGTSGKGVIINKLINPLDPRGFVVYTIKDETEEERRRPFLQRLNYRIHRTEGS